MQLKAFVEIGVAIALVLLVPVVIAVVRVSTRRDRDGLRKIPVRPYQVRSSRVSAPLVLPESAPIITAAVRAPTPPMAPAMANRIDSYLMEAIAATGTRLPTSVPAPSRVARGSVAPPVRARTIRDVNVDEFEDDPPTLVSLRPLR